MKSKILLSIAVAIAFSVAVAGLPVVSQAAALTQRQISAVMTLLQAFGADQSVINNVQSALTGGTSGGGGSGGGTAWCYTFNNNLKMGNTGSDITALHTALSLERPRILTQAVSENEFDEITASTVVAFQEKYASEILTPNGLLHGTGFVGASTRAKLNSLYGCNVVRPPTPQPSITVLSPNGGESYAVGQTVPISWSTSNFVGVVTIKLWKNSSMESETVPITILSQVTNAGRYNWTIPSNVTSGSYRINVILNNDRDGIQDYSDSFFTVTSETDQPSSVSIIAGPVVSTATSNTYYLLSPATWRDAEAKAVSMGGHLATVNDLAENRWIVNTFGRYGGTTRQLWIGLNDSDQEGTWRWVADGSVATYLNWATGEPNSGQGVYSDEDGVHIWSPDDSRYVVGSWNDSMINNWRFNSVVEVGSGTSQPSITVLSPNGGESFQVGSSARLSWTSSNVPLDDGGIIQVQNILTGETPLQRNIAVNGGSLSNYGGSLPWTVSGSAGQYRVTVCSNTLPMPSVPFKPLCDSSDSYFTITSPTANQPTLTSVLAGGANNCVEGGSLCRAVVTGTGFTPTGNTVRVGVTSVGLNVSASNDNRGNLTSYDNGTKINVDIPTNLAASTYRVVVSNANGTSGSVPFTMSPNSSQPDILSVSPSSGPVGTIITLTGTGFSRTGTNYIQMTPISGSGSIIPGSSLQLQAQSADGTHLTFTLPNVAVGTAFKIWVDNEEFGASDENRSYLARPKTFTVTAPVTTRPTLTSVLAGGANNCVEGGSLCRAVVTGTGFTPTGNTVRVGVTSVGLNVSASNDNRGNLTSYDNGTKINVDIPTTLSPNTYLVVVSNARGTSGSVPFTMSPNSSQPYITSVSPSSGPVGTIITLLGTGFSTGTNYIQMIPTTGTGSIQLQARSADGAHLTITLPNVAVGTTFKIYVDNEQYGASDENVSYMANIKTFTVTAPARESSTP